LSRPPADIPRVFGGKPVAMIGASPRNVGTILSQEAWLPVLRTLGISAWFGGRLFVSRARSMFDEGGGIANDATKEQVRQFIDGCVTFVRSCQPSGLTR
jgi:chromate reductase, NAD(P)H dehydrogenase (quinone)